MEDEWAASPTGRLESSEFAMMLAGTGKGKDANRELRTANCEPEFYPKINFSHFSAAAFRTSGLDSATGGNSSIQS